MPTSQYAVVNDLTGIVQTSANTVANKHKPNNRQRLFRSLRRTKSLHSPLSLGCNNRPLRRPRHPLPTLLGALGVIFATSQLQASTVFINELHYDNEGSDSNEGIELAGVAGFNIDGWQLQFYNGNNGGIYKSSDLAGTFSDQYNGFGIMHIVTGALQNGPADGVALVDSLGNVTEFLSYEGTLAATEGAASGMSSVDIGVAEPVNFPLGMSLQRVGQGGQGSDFSWHAGTASFGFANDSQLFASTVSEVPLPAGGVLFASGIAGLLLGSRRGLRN
ncbi:MAG: hypothetical protein HKO07_06135 [Pseudomonadales bacterium]|nr:hypothetical protein [Pseudomonadales bacterium]